MRAIGNKYPCKQTSYNKEELKIESKLSFISVLLYFCDPVGIQTQDLQNRNLTLYSAKLRDLTACKGNKKFRVLRLVDGVL